MESILTKLLIDVYEVRDITISDVPGAYLQADFLEGSINERVLLKLTGEFVDIMCKANPEHLPNIVVEKVKKILYMPVL